MKIAISAKGNTTKSQTDERFGRCNFFVLYDDDTRQIESFVNPAATASGGAGPAAAQELIKHNVQTVISGSVGVNAQQALEAAGIQIVTMEAATVQEALDNYIKKREN